MPISIEEVLNNTSVSFKNIQTSFLANIFIPKVAEFILFGDPLANLPKNLHVLLLSQKVFEIPQCAISLTGNIIFLQQIT